MATWEALLSAADKQIPGYKNLVLSAAEHAGAAVDWPQVESLIESGQAAQAVPLIDAAWQPVAGSLQNALKQQNLAALGAGAHLGLVDVQAFAGSALPTAALGGVFDITNPRAVLFAGTRSSALITAIGEQQRAAVRQIITRATSGEFTTKKAAQLIRGTVGLDPRRAQALATYTAKVFAAAEGAKAIAAAQKAADRYAAKLLQQRALVIARTEVLTSAHEGVQEAWLAARDKGLLGKGLVKRWIITPDDRLCPFCQKMKVNGVAQQVPMDQPFVTPFGPRMMPPMHPQCRCSAGLIRGFQNLHAPIVKPVPTVKQLPQAKPRIVKPASRPRSIPSFRPPLPPDPPEVLKLKSLGFNPDGTFATKPWATAQYTEVIDQTTLQQAMQAGKEYVEYSATIPAGEIPSFTSVTHAVNGEKLSEALLDDVMQAMGQAEIKGTVLIKTGGKNVYIGNEHSILAAWAKDKPLTGVIRVDVDKWVRENSPIGKLKKLGVTQDGFIADVPFKKAGNIYSETFTKKAIPKAAKAAQVETVDISAIYFRTDGPPLYAQVMEDVLAVPTKPNIVLHKIDGKLIAGNNTAEYNTLKAYLKGDTQVDALVHDFDAAVSEIKAANKASSQKFLAKQKAAKQVAVQPPPKLATAISGADETIAPAAKEYFEETLGLKTSGPDVNPLFQPQLEKLKKLPHAKQVEVVNALKAPTNSKSLSLHLDEALAAENASALAQQQTAQTIATGVGKTPAQPITFSAPVRTKIDDIAFKKIGEAKGSNPGGLFEAKDGTKWYVKYYSDADQGVGEVAANAIYRDLGIGAPESITGVLADGKTAFASKFLDDTVRTVGSGITKAEADQILDGFAADVLTGNWDAVGTGLDNVVLRAGGKVTRIDQGGTFLFRAKAGRKPANLLEQITEWEKFADSSTNPYYAQVFQAAGYSNADELGKRAVQQIEKIVQLRDQAGGWDRYLARAIPDSTPAQQRALAQMLDARTKLLQQKRADILEALKPAPPRATSFAPAARSKADRFGQQLAGHHTFDDAVKAASANKGRGTSLAFDGDDIEGFDVRVRAVSIEGEEWTEVKMKLTEDAGHRFRTASPIRNQLKENSLNLPSQTATSGKVTTMAGVQDSGGMFPGAKTYKYESPTLKIFHHQAAGANYGGNGFSYGNLTQVYFKGKPTAEQIEAVMRQQLGIRSVSYPSDGALQAYRENAFVRLFQKGNATLTPTQRTKLIADVKRQYGVEPEDLRLVAGALERPTLEWTPQAAQRMVQKTGIRWFGHSLSSSDADTIVRILQGDQEGLLSTTIRYTEGVGGEGMSSSTDVTTGGADYVFTRQHSEALPSTSRHGMVVIKPDVLRRIDWFAYDSDSFGAQNAAYSSYSHSIKTRDNLQNLISGAKHGGSQETMFRSRISWDDVEYVAVGRYYRDEVIRKLKAAGINRIGGKTVEQFVRLAKD